MSDYIVRATAADSQIRAFAITSKEMVEEARRAHDTRPVITAALGRLLSGAAMMGTMMKGDNDLLTIQIQCGGPAKGLTVTADSHGHVKGFPMESQVELPLNAQGKLDVGGALGLGVMSVIKDMGLNFFVFETIKKMYTKIDFSQEKRLSESEKLICTLYEIFKYE